MQRSFYAISIQEVSWIPKTAHCHEHPTFFPISFWGMKSWAKVPFWTTGLLLNSLSLIFLCSLEFTIPQLKLLVHYCSDCIPTYREYPSLFIISRSLILFLRSCAGPSHTYLCSYLCIFPPILPSQIQSLGAVPEAIYPGLCLGRNSQKVGHTVHSHSNILKPWGGVCFWNGVITPAK